MGKSGEGATRTNAGQPGDICSFRSALLAAWLGLLGLGLHPTKGLLILLSSRHRAFVQVFSSQRESSRQGSANPGCFPSLWKLLGEVM